MKYKNIPSNTLLFFIFCGILTFVFLKPSEERQMQQLQGKWELALNFCEALLHSQEGILPVGFDNISTVNLFPEIKKKQDIITLLFSEGKNQDIQYGINDNILRLDWLSKDFMVKWKQFDDILSLEYNMPVSSNDNGITDKSGRCVILSIYKRGWPSV